MPRVSSSTAAGRCRFATSLLLALLCPVAASHGAAQSLARYQATSYTLRYQSINSYLLYFVRGSDTLGTPVTTRIMESRQATTAGDGLAVWVGLKGISEPSLQHEETFTVDPSGRLLAVGGRPLAQLASARVDLLPRFPPGAPELVAGMSWTDTVSISGQEPYGPTSYSVTRQYRVLRIVDSMGTRIAHLAGTGRMHIRQGGWQDQAQKISWWQDISGPVADTVWFDPAHGVLLAAVAVMNLTGTGGVTGSPPMPSGLRSAVRLGPL